MKKLVAGTLTAALAALLSYASPMFAGSFTVATGPTFTPDTAFTNNTIAIDATTGAELIRVNGGATITPDATNQAMISLDGGYSADAGDIFSAAYSFVVDMNALTSVTYTISGTAVVFGITVPFSATGTLDPGLHKYEGTISVPDATFPTATSGTWTAALTLDFGGGSPNSAAPGTLDLQIQQIDVQLAPEAAMLEAPAQQQNVSTRGNVGTGDDVLIGGFIITGTDAKQVVIRAVGPSIVGVTGLLADPFLELHDSTGALITSNDNWGDLSTDDQTVLTDNDLAPLDPAESALVMTLDPGNYTAIVRGVGDTTGIALVEIYDLDTVSGTTTDSKLANLSTRGNVGVDPNILDLGVIVGGTGTGFSTIIIRGLGPSLTDQGVPNVLADPTLDLLNENADVIASNDNWEADPANMQSVMDAGLAPTDSNEAAIYEVLPPGKYTAVLSGAGGTTGVGLVETYNIDD
jgi:hypothetical protein